MLVCLALNSTPGVVGQEPHPAVVAEHPRVRAAKEASVSSRAVESSWASLEIRRAVRDRVCPADSAQNQRLAPPAFDRPKPQLSLQSAALAVANLRRDTSDDRRSRELPSEAGARLLAQPTKTSRSRYFALLGSK